MADHVVALLFGAVAFMKPTNAEEFRMVEKLAAMTIRASLDEYIERLQNSAVSATENMGGKK